MITGRLDTSVHGGIMQEKRNRFVTIILCSIVVFEIFLFSVGGKYIDKYTLQNYSSTVFSVPISFIKDGGSIVYYGLFYKVLLLNQLTIVDARSAYNVGEYTYWWFETIDWNSLDSTIAYEDRGENWPNLALLGFRLIIIIQLVLSILFLNKKLKKHKEMQGNHPTIASSR